LSESANPGFRIVHVPTDEEMKPTPEECEHLRRIRQWETDSAKNLADFEIGVPYDLQRPRSR
jgi:hypothetical protein